MNKVEPTSCSDCVWAKYASGTQTGCEFGRIEKFKEVGAKVSLKLEKRDSGLQTYAHNYYIIDRFCNMKRTKEWSELYQNPKEKLLELTQVKYDIIVPFLELHGEQQDKEWIRSFLDDVMGKEYIPETIHFVFPNSYNEEKYNVKPIVEMCNSYFAPLRLIPIHTKFYITQFEQYDPEKESIITNRYKMVNHAAIKNKGMYYIVILPEWYESNDDDYIPNNIGKKLNKIVNEDLKMAFVIEPPEDTMHGLVVHNEIHKAVAGHSHEEETVSDKLLNSVKPEDLEKVILFWGENT